MSLPIPSTGGNRQMDPKQLQALDAPLIALTQQCGGDLRQVLFAFFSFLNRRTDFYLIPHPDQEDTHKMGFKQGDAEKLLLASFRQFPLRRIPKAGPPPQTASAKPAPKKKNEEAPAKKASPETKSETEEKATTSNSTNKDSKDSKESNETTGTGNMEGVRFNEENGLQIPVGNGGSTKKYKWTQTIEECSVLVGVPKGLRGRDLDVKITPSSLSVKTKKPIAGSDGPLTFVDGKLSHKVRSDESTWSVEGGVVIVTLDKLQKTFWSNVIEGDDKIDTELVDNRRRIGEYDDATQAQFRKIIFDQQQYHIGGPTSDEILQKKAGTSIPPLPPGVEYIDKKKLDAEDKKKKAAS